MSDVVLREVAGAIGKAVAEAISTLADAVAKHPMFVPSAIAVGIAWSTTAMHRWLHQEG